MAVRRLAALRVVDRRNASPLCRQAGTVRPSYPHAADRHRGCGARVGRGGSHPGLDTDPGASPRRRRYFPFLAPIVALSALVRPSRAADADMGVHHPLTLSPYELINHTDLPG